jgi:hypothetical protein
MIGWAYWLARRRCSRFSDHSVDALDALASLGGHGVGGHRPLLSDSLQRRALIDEHGVHGILAAFFAVVTGPMIFRPSADSHEVSYPAA